MVVANQNEALDLLLDAHEDGVPNSRDSCNQFQFLISNIYKFLKTRVQQYGHKSVK